MIDKVSLDKFITGEGDDEYENQYTIDESDMDDYEKRFIESQDAVRKYVGDLIVVHKRLNSTQKKLNLAVDIILALREKVTLIPTEIQKQINSLAKGGYRG